MDLINDGILWNHICSRLPHSPADAVYSPITNAEIWSDGDQILVDDGKAADAIADFLDAIGFDTHVGYYHPEEDKRSGEVDDHTGYYYIDID